ncbi:MAG: PAS domain-containing protein, partial [Ktedonobacterales bacterium]
MFTRGGEMGTLMRSLDWSATATGLVERWPQSLRTAVSICLASRFPIIIFWGPSLVQFYNDAYRPILGATKHPAALGQEARACWPEIWDVIGPMLNGVLATGEATWSDDQLLLLDRNGYPEECYFTFSYSPIRDESGGVGGVFCAVTETTGRVLSERRQYTLRELAARAADTFSEDAARRGVGEALENAVAMAPDMPGDLPLARLYLLETDGAVAQLAVRAGMEPPLYSLPDRVRLSSQVLPTGMASDQETVRESGEAPRDAAADGQTGTERRMALALALARVASTGQAEVVELRETRTSPPAPSPT